MTNTFEFFIPGEPAPGGSKSAFPIYRNGKLVLKDGRPIIRMVDSGGERNETWKKVVTAYGRKFMMAARPFTCAMQVDFIFFLRRPNDHFISGNRERPLKDDAPAYHISKPDALKFARSTEDALTGVIWQDDSQTVRITSEKRWAEGVARTGCTVRFTVLTIDRPEPVQKSLL